MGQDLTIKAGNKSFSFRVSRSDWDTLRALRKLLPLEVELLLDMPDGADSETIKRSEMKAAALQIQSTMRSNKDLLPYTYQFSREFDSNPLQTGKFSTGGQSGIQLVGDTDHYYSLWAGFDKLLLKKSAVQPNGQGVLVDTKDLRGTAELLSSNMGKISIRKSRTRTDVTKLLKDLIAFLETVDATIVLKSFG